MTIRNEISLPTNHKSCAFQLHKSCAVWATGSPVFNCPVAGRETFLPTKESRQLNQALVLELLCLSDVSQDAGRQHNKAKVQGEEQQLIWG